PGLDIRQMFGQVRADVDQSTQGGQTPWVNEAIIGSFAMAGKVETPQPVKAIEVEPQAAAQPAPQPVVEPQAQPELQQQAAVEPVEPTPAPRNNQVEFILPDSGTRRLNWNDISGLSGQQLRLARNEIYARRGRYMKDTQLRAYFSQFSWYRPWTWNVELSAVEKANVALIQRAEAGQ
ncbi:YARHG domain-containing protein, partial [Labrys sp. LIt4]|uniref:YARHG domain-containing protein n=1 Tax=Labrys sp. LIt4 TaxID=2821355 RepID=UPI001ADF6C46